SELDECYSPAILRNLDVENAEGIDRQRVIREDDECRRGKLGYRRARHDDAGNESLAVVDGSVDIVAILVEEDASRTLGRRFGGTRGGRVPAQGGLREYAGAGNVPADHVY